MQDITELKLAQSAAGARFREGSAAPEDYGDPHAEYASAQAEAAVFDLCDRAQIEITGKDRVKFLHSFSTNDIKNLKPGSGCEAFLPNVQGKVLAHLYLFAGADSLRLESVGGSAERIIAHLSKYQINEDVEFHDRSDAWGTLFLSGPDATRRISDLYPDAGSLARLQHAAVAGPGGQSLEVRRTDLLGKPGYELVMPREKLAAVWQALVAQGAKPAGSAVFEALRIEACTPLYGPDISDANLAQEVNRTPQAISFNKGCYLGQEPIARIDALGHVNQSLVGLRLSGGTVPAPGAEVVTAGAEEKVIGRITSAAISFARDLPVALGYVRRQFNAPGAEVRVRVGTELIPAELYWQVNT